MVLCILHRSYGFTNKNMIVMNYDYMKYISKYKNYFKNENYNDLIKDIKDNKVSRVIIDKNYQEVVSLHNDNNKIEKELDNYEITKVNPILITNVIDKSSETNTKVEVADLRPNYIGTIDSGINFVSNTLSLILPLILLSSFISFVSRNPMANMFNNNNFKGNIKSNKNMQFNPFNNKNNKNDYIIKSNITLKNWAGSIEVVDECKEIIHYIENKELFNKMGAEMPKGILLEGPPGTGKTLLAKAIAGETNSTFISISGSEFVELFVGMGASRVRELFMNARNNNPSIIFIDEIDAVARQRGAGFNNGNDEREQTLNQLLYEMDGFNNNENIVVIAATNRKDVLDQAILRPGRFDRIIRVPLPDKDSREKIIDFYLSNKNFENNFNISSIAELTDGFSGAQLKNLINEAIILSARNNYTVLQEQYIFEAFEKTLVGLIKKNATIAPATQRRVAIHESGHSILAILFNDTFEFKKASIQPTYNGAGGYTLFNEKRNEIGGLYTKDLLKKRLIIGMGGKAAESLYYGNEHVSLGAIEDLRQANQLAKRMIGNYGMGNDLEVFFNEDISDESNRFIGKSMSFGERYSEHTKYLMDKESLELVQSAYKTAIELLKSNYEKLLLLSDILIDKKVVYNNITTIL